MAESRIEELRSRLAREPGSRLFAQLAEEHRKAGDPAEAIRVARAGLALHPVYASARLTLGRALLDAGDAAGARAELEQALRQAPENILARRFLAQALESVGDLERALAEYRATLKLAPGDRQLEDRVQAVGARLSGSEKPQKPVPAPAPGPRDSEAQGPAGEPPFASATLAELYLRQGFAQRAIEVYQEVIAADPGNARARARLVEIESAGAAAGPGAADASECARRSVERTIAGLEALLEAARRGR